MSELNDEGMLALSVASLDHSLMLVAAALRLPSVASHKECESVSLELSACISSMCRLLDGLDRKFDFDRLADTFTVEDRRALDALAGLGVRLRDRLESGRQGSVNRP